ncbi:serine threonine kinase [Fusarium subglutinans]|uniref:Serine threonine kinase n=1 Tax=Gibberella subglutinans TaxID=42677 RepID=A0A8H5Q4N1_GIBSU|nr:serine threonine kinase [Fusarium subglutinans]KAF5608592.1 serine threonine kinase [Fusarium subglutinans]
MLWTNPPDPPGGVPYWKCSNCDWGDCQDCMIIDSALLCALMDIEYEEYRSSSHALPEAIDDTQAHVSETDNIISASIKAAKIVVAHFDGTMQSPDGVWQDSGTMSPRAATCGTVRRRFEPGWTSRQLLFPGITVDDPCLLDKADPPFYDFGSSSRPIFDEAEAIKSGGTSQVSRVRVCLQRTRGYGGEGRGEATFAVKKIDSGTYQDYARERDAYRRLTFVHDPHPHIVRLLASYRMESRYHLVFPSADCDLAMYWRNHPRPSDDKRTVEWLGGQMRGLADALSTVHGQNGVHGDIKPENILCFGSDNRQTVLALTDFGSSYFLAPEEKQFPKGLKHTPVYRAPEIDTHKSITQAYDIWSLGCVFAEAIVWFYDGKAGIAKLIRARLDEEDGSPNRDAFFWLKQDDRLGLTAKLKPEVQRLLVSLRENSRSSFFIDDMLYIVLEGMLQVDMSKRMSAREILDALTQMCSKLENDPTYSEFRNSDTKMVHTNQNARQRLDRTVDATYYTNTTTQSLSDAATQIGLKLRFACPFHKAGILVSVHHRACEGPGWIDVNKVKEHLFRCHLPKKYRGKHICRRCDTSFETDELLLAHQHQETPCPKRKPEAIHGMLSREQAARLRSLKRKSSKESEEDRWFDIHRIVFPNFNRMLENISPYHESNTTSLSTVNSTSSNGISQYKDYLRNRDAEEYAAKLAENGITITVNAASKLLELQVKELGTFDETVRGPVSAYGIPTVAGHEKTGESAPSNLNGSSDFMDRFQLLAGFEGDKDL